MTEPGEPVRPGTCPNCEAPLDFSMKRKFKDIAHMVFNNEWVSLEPFPVELFCTAECGYRMESVGREFTVDMDKGVVLFGRIDKPGS